mmetsp:Transcript_11814/g.31781  ORF Transcript_11814/g.31781 Transcript_11814/m.31781 type:complete len:213 (-) Transcript_11814:6-644(-)
MQNADAGKSINEIGAQKRKVAECTYFSLDPEVFLGLQPCKLVCLHSDGTPEGSAELRILQFQKIASLQLSAAKYACFSELCAEFAQLKLGVEELAMHPYRGADEMFFVDVFQMQQVFAWRRSCARPQFRARPRSTSAASSLFHLCISCKRIVLSVQPIASIPWHHALICPRTFRHATAPHRVQIPGHERDSCLGVDDEPRAAPKWRSVVLAL